MGFQQRRDIALTLTLFSHATLRKPNFDQPLYILVARATVNPAFDSMNVNFPLAGFVGCQDHQLSRALTETRHFTSNHRIPSKHDHRIELLLLLLLLPVSQSRRRRLLLLLSLLLVLLLLLLLLLPRNDLSGSKRAGIMHRFCEKTLWLVAAGV